jgi:phenylalanine-4-hydroxylase
MGYAVCGSDDAAERKGRFAFLDGLDILSLETAGIPDFGALSEK